jgi:hypothetical protein
MFSVALAGPLLLQQLPPDVAARQAGRTTASAPSPDNWLLQLLPPAGQTWGDYEPGVWLCACVLSELCCTATHVLYSKDRLCLMAAPAGVVWGQAWWDRAGCCPGFYRRVLLTATVVTAVSLGGGRSEVQGIAVA